MTKSKIFIWIAVSFSLGVFMASCFNLPTIVVYVLIAMCAIVFSLSFISHHKTAALSALFLCSACLGALRLQATMVANEYQNLLGQKQSFEGYVVEDVDLRSNLQYLTFKPKGFNQNILISTPLSQEFFYGDWLYVEGKAEEAKNFEDFDYQKYLQRYNTYAVIRYPKILILKSHQQNPIKEQLLRIKAAFVARVSQLFYEPQGSLLLGIIIGAKKTLPADVISDFNNTGTSHIIAISGFNITILISALAGLAYLFGRRVSFWLSLITIVGFVIMAGASASVVRAAIMGFLLLLSFNIDRQYSVIPSIFFAGVIMLFINPKILFWDVGFQLSFAATLGIIYFLPQLETLCQKLPDGFGVKVAILGTLSAILATLPIILIDFGTLSLSAPIVNVLVLPLVPATMLFGFLCVLPFVGAGFAFITNLLLAYMLIVTHFFAHLPYSVAQIQTPLWLFWLLCLVVVGLYFSLRLINKKKALSLRGGSL